MDTVWEIDFYSRPILDDQQKKVWEVLVCDAVQTNRDDPAEGFHFSKYLSSTQVNSIQLKAALEEALALAPNPPKRIRFFRYQMQNMINRACDELGIPTRLSRRTFALKHWLDEREQQVYPAHPNYQPSTNPIVSPTPPSPRPLPDPLIGQQWAFVTLEASAFTNMEDWDISFGEAFPLAMADLSPEAKIPGLLIFSPRALPLGGWLSGLELAGLRVERGAKPRLLLETAVTDSWILAPLVTPALQAEATNFEKAKQAANQVHFLAVQASPEEEAFAGFWLLRDMEMM